MRTFSIYFLLFTLFAASILCQAESIRMKRATCWSWDGGDDCRKKCQDMTNSCTNEKYDTGHCEFSWIGATCVCKPECDE
ncbi:unnamed protein product, partial [Mesorhabditis belari]|uniref:Uncharacterized protein n=1 Tax=Mesorhabditis belari TaxID=2138241 RepID=A0AAF3J706_9BILA